MQHHASIAVWAGNNENEAALVQNWYDTNENYEQYKSDYIALYVDTIMPAVAEQDTTRTYLVISFASFLMFYNFYLEYKSKLDGYRKPPFISIIFLKTSSPSNGVEKTKEAGWVNTDPQSSFWGDRHFYTYNADGWDPTSYPDGPRFVSEFGSIL